MNPGLAETDQKVQKGMIGGSRERDYHPMDGFYLHPPGEEPIDLAGFSIHFATCG
jgi:hypothetical protein